MKSRIVFAVLAALLVANAPVRSADAVPDWTLRSGEGVAVTLTEELKEQTVVLFFWATWCPYCKALMPHLQSIRFEYGDGVKILAIDFRDKGDPIAFMKEAGYDFTLLLDGDEVAELYGVYGTPGVIVVDQNQQARFDLRDLPRPAAAGGKAGHKSKAACLAPYWAAAIRKNIDVVLAETGITATRD